MAHTWVSTVKLPGESTSREIVPYKVGISNSSDITVSLPSNLNVTDAHFLLDRLNQEVQGQKTFVEPIYLGSSDSGSTGSIYFWDSSAATYYEQDIFDDVWTIKDDNNNNVFSIDIYNRYIEWMAGNDQSYYGYTFPQRSGTIGLQIDIVDLT